MDRERDAMRGSPSPWKVFARTAREAKERARRERVSERVRDVFDGTDIMMAVVCARLRSTCYVRVGSWEVGGKVGGLGDQARGAHGC